MADNRDRENKVLEFPSDEVFTIKLRDGVARQIRFTNGAMKAIKRKLKMSVLRGDVFRNLDEDLFAEVLWEVIVPSDREDLEGPAAIDGQLDAPLMLYLIQQLGYAFAGATPKNETSQGRELATTPATLQ